MAEPIYRLTRAQLGQALRGTIEMYLEFRDTHGKDDDQARLYGVGEVLDGLDADQELAASDPTEHLRLQLSDAHDALLAELEEALDLFAYEFCYRSGGEVIKVGGKPSVGGAWVERARAAMTAARGLPADTTAEQLQQVKDGILIWRGDHWEMPPA